MPFPSRNPCLQLARMSYHPIPNMFPPLPPFSGIQSIFAYDVLWILTFPWLLQCSSLAPFPAQNQAVVSIATIGMIEEDEEEEEDKEAEYIDQGSSTKDLVPKQAPVEVEKEGTMLEQEDRTVLE